MTIFFEPLQVVTYNNEINLLAGEEKEEEYRILADLSMKVREEIQNLEADFEILGDLDLLYAMAKFSILLKGVQPYLTEDGKIEMREARHPLLALQKEERGRSDSPPARRRNKNPHHQRRECRGKDRGPKDPGAFDPDGSIRDFPFPWQREARPGFFTRSLP